MSDDETPRTVQPEPGTDWGTPGLRAGLGGNWAARVSAGMWLAIRVQAVRGAAQKRSNTMGMIISEGLVPQTLLRWQVESATFDAAPFLRVVAEVADAAPAVLASVLRHVLEAQQLSPHERVLVLEQVLLGLRTTGWRATMLGQRVDVALEVLRVVRRDWQRDPLWLVTPEGRRCIGTVQLHGDLTWYGHLAGAYGGSTLGPHPEADGETLIHRMCRVAAGLPDTYVPPPEDNEAPLPPVAVVLELRAGGRS